MNRGFICGLIGEVGTEDCIVEMLYVYFCFFGFISLWFKGDITSDLCGRLGFNVSWLGFVRRDWESCLV